MTLRKAFGIAFCVHFLLLSSRSITTVAHLCRFFNSTNEMQASVSLHRRPLFANMLPPLIREHPEPSSTLQHDGQPVQCPAFLVRQQGITVRKWFSQTGKRSPAEVRDMLAGVSAHLAALHKQGMALGGLRADLVIFLEHTQEWRLLGLSRASSIGELLVVPGMTCFDAFAKN
jgi:hypothetical protein